MSLSACTSDTPELIVASCCAVCSRDGQYCPSAQYGGTAPWLPSDIGCVDSPLQKIVAPSSEQIIGTCAPELYCTFKRSAILPAHPLRVRPLTAWFCHSSCWSGCENRL